MAMSTMTFPLRCFLILCAALLLLFVLRRIKKSQMQIEDSVFWFLFALSFVLLAVFPQIAYFFAGVLGFDSPVNFMFVYVVGVLVVREFSLTATVAGLKRRQKELVQQIALDKEAEAKEKRER